MIKYINLRIYGFYVGADLYVCPLCVNEFFQWAQTLNFFNSLHHKQLPFPRGAGNLQ